VPPEAVLAGSRRGPTKGDRRREAILEAIERLLRDRPIGRLSVEEIAVAAGISRSAFYFYLESKYAALNAALGGVWDEMVAAASNFFEDDGEPPPEYVRRALGGVGALWREHEPLLVAMVDAAATDERARELWDGWMDRWIERVAARIEEERAAGRALPAPPDARSLARVLLAMNERSYYLDRRRQASAAESARTVEALAATWLAVLWGQTSTEEDR
jgi:AcrR family transcriptional regulator